MEKKMVDVEDKYIRWFSDLHNGDIGVAGGKGASLGEMFNAKFPVPPGFVVTAQAFKFFMEHHKLKEKISDIIIGIDMNDTGQLQEKAKEIREMIVKEDLPDELKNEILEAYHILSSEKIDEKGVSEDALNILKNSQEPIFVSIRSSATTEDLADASFAGQQDSFLNVKGDMDIIENVKKCIASLYTARAIYYRNKKGFEEGAALLAVVVQKMIDSEKSGVVFSKDPVTLNDDIIVEAVYGLGEGIVSGKINPDNYIVSSDLKIKKITTTDKKIAIVRTGSGQNEIVKLSDERSHDQVLTNGEILEIANYAVRLEKHYKKPQDIEFALEENKIYILQSRPITTLKAGEKVKEIDGKVLLEGLAASPGIGVGSVKIIQDMKDLSKIKKGDVLVTEMTNPDMVVDMQKSSAIVTDEGGITSHASIVSREMGIPAVVGVGDATKVLKDGMKITVDGSSGKVYEGEIDGVKATEIKPVVETSKIKLKVILDLPDFAERAAESGLDSVGLTRLEGIIASSEKHPLEFEKEGKLDEYTELLKTGIEKIAKPFKLVWIRSSDIRSDEYANLKGAPEEEINPMLGFHGIRFSLKHPGLFKAELEAVKKVAEKYPDKKLGVMFPQIISVEELKETKKIFNEIKTENMQIGVMIETPAGVQIIDELVREGIDFISFGTNDLTQYTLAVDRGNEDVQYLYNELHPAILSQIKKVIRACKGKVETSICGQAGSKKEMVEFLIKEGIDSISVNADAAHNISVFVKELESQIKGEVKEEVLGEKRKFERDDNQKKSKKEKGNIITCDACGKESRVPFRPKPGRPVYCRDCYKKKKSNKLPALPRDNVPAKIENYEDNKKSLENESLGIRDVREVKVADVNEDIGTIAPIDNVNSIEDKTDEILSEVKKEKEAKVSEDKKVEDRIEVSGGRVSDGGDGSEEVKSSGEAEKEKMYEIDE